MRNPLHARDYRILVLILESQDYDPRVLIRWVRANVGKIQVECDKDAPFAADSLRDCVILKTAKVFVPDSLGVEARV